MVSKLINNGFIAVEIVGKRDILSYFDLTDAQRQIVVETYGGLVDIEDQSYIFNADDEVVILGDIMRTTERIGTRNWHGYHGDSYFSGTLYMLSADGETALVARYYS